MFYSRRPVEAMQVPARMSNEADKDLEARFMKLCAWLDGKGKTDIDFSIGKDAVWTGDDITSDAVLGWIEYARERRTGYIRDDGPLVVKAYEGVWLIWEPEFNEFSQMDNDYFQLLYKEETD